MLLGAALMSCSPRWLAFVDPNDSVDHRSDIGGAPTHVLRAPVMFGGLVLLFVVFALCRKSGASEAIQSHASLPGGVVTCSLVLVWLGNFCDYVLMFMCIPIFPSLGKSNLQTGCLFAAKATFQILSSPLMARIVDHHGKAMLLGGLCLESLSILAFMFTHDYVTWFCARALSGVASASIISSGLAHLSKRYSDTEQRAVAMGFSATGIMAGTCIGPVMGGVLYEISPGLPFLILASLELLVVVLVWLFLPDLKVDDLDAKVAEASTGELLRNADVFRFLGVLVITNTGCGCVEGTIARRLIDTFGLHPGQVGKMYLLLALSSIVFAAASGDLGNTVGRVTVIRAGLLIQGLAIFLGATSSLAWTAVSLMMMGVGIGLIDGATPPLLEEIVQKHFASSGRIFVMSNTCVQLGFLVGPLMGNAIIDCWGYTICCICGGALVLGCCASLGNRLDDDEKHQATDRTLLAR